MKASYRALAAAESIEQREADLERVLDTLDNPSCRRILECLGTEPATASELALRCDIPLSTLYRHLRELAETPLVEKTLRLDASGRHAAQYARTVTDVVISLSPETGIRLDVNCSDRDDDVAVLDAHGV